MNHVERPKLKSHKRRKRVVTTVPLAAALAAALGAGLLASTPDSAKAAPSTGTGTGAPARTVTLVTGDRVTLDAEGKVTGVTAAEGREGMAFRIQQAAGHAYVLPRDAEPLIANGTADRRLFDVTQLVSSRYDDARRSDLPLIVTYDKGASLSASTFRSSGATVRRDLPSINGDAVRTRKSEGSALWETLTSGTGSAKVRKIWLDGKVKATLDRSMPQIGAPAAHAAGYDGKGVEVAVLDSGVDSTHPDLKDRIAAAKNFSTAADTVDRAGHGTHVASTIAGSGTVSPAGAKYEGVAPGVRLLVGKVLDDEGSGEDSGVIAGMQWAVAQGAKVVNMSLGGTDTPGIDPVEQAVNDLSASSGALFVIAAGNEGPGEGTIGTPGSAAAALTVGAVDRKDAIAEFSSRGPTADGFLKPDVTAPGVDIVAAKAAEGFMGDPAADGYVSMSGTSMATPHVAGAAAILAQQHPDWSGRQIKAALTASAKPTAATSSYTQGTGRVDVARVIDQRLTSSPTALGFGTQAYPHTDDQPVTKDVTYRNAGTEPVTLDLATEAYGNDGKPAAEGLFTVSPQRLTVPAGGEATATVTTDTRVGTADGSFGGSLTATTADGTTTARTSLGVVREVESYDLTLKHLDLKGKAPRDAATGIYGLDNDIWTEAVSDRDGEVTIRLPRGRYALEGMFVTGSAGRSVLLHPKFALTKDTTLVMDARRTKPVKVTLPDGAAKPNGAMFFFHVDVNDKPYTSVYDAPSFGSIRVGQLGAPAPAAEVSAMYHGIWTHKSVNYRLAWNRTGDLSGFTKNVKRSQLTKVKVVVGAPVKGRTGSVWAAPLMPGGFYNLFQTEGRLPLTGTDYVLPNGIKWFYQTGQLGAPDAEGEPTWENTQVSTARAYAAGRDYTQRFNIGVFGPSLPSDPLANGGDSTGAVRVGNTFAAYVPLFSDGVGNTGTSTHTKAKSSLYADGKKIFAVNDPLNGDSYTVPAGKRTYKLGVDVSRAPAQFAVSTRTTATWTFTSAHVPGDTAKRLPLTVVRYTPKLSTASTAKAGTTLAVPFGLEGAATKVGTLRKLAFTVSYDDGRTWKKTTAVNGKLLKLRSPAEPGPVSLRVALTDADGNTLTQTIHRAYRTTK
ncbi:MULTISPECIES: S8 family peptidase [Streptomyces]|uniref:S8 family peptidase n=1 Tax=Streptomyces TaxID=1883 RepID=UPI000A38D17E|nr:MULTISPECIES: S8 family peptidase [Streptomyces]MDX3636228.1 S8 family peptidase [Streptomyces europaeiscabiei]MDX3654194.1 S8 family peptidase [Streptomyces europaeiscabiei]